MINKDTQDSRIIITLMKQPATTKKQQPTPTPTTLQQQQPNMWSNKKLQETMGNNRKQQHQRTDATLIKLTTIRLNDE